MGRVHMENTMKQMLTKKQMAAFAGVQPRTIDNWMKVGLMPYLKIGKTVRFDPDAVMKHLHKYKQGGHAKAWRRPN